MHLRQSITNLLLASVLPLVAQQSVQAQGLQTSQIQSSPNVQTALLDPRLAPIQLDRQQRAIVPTPDVLPTDATPIGTAEERLLLTPAFRFKAFERLPRRLWFTCAIDNSQRLDTNTLFTANKPQPDYIYRALPHLTVGYNFLRRTSVYSDYFVIKDVFADHGTLSHPTTQSLALGFRQDIPLNRRLTGRLDFQARELWQSANTRQSDLLPTLNLTYAFSPRTLAFGNCLLQLRGNRYFGGANREIDPFYSVGLVHRRGLWIFSITDTYVQNFRNPRQSTPIQSNQAMIFDIQVTHPVAKRLPGILWFVQAEHIWNWRSRRVPGMSGYDFRLQTGIRFVVAKAPPGATEMKKMIQEKTESDESATPPGKTRKPGTEASPLPVSGASSAAHTKNDPPLHGI